MRMSVTVARCELCATFDMSNVDAAVGRLAHDPNPEETDTMNAAESPRHSVRIHIDREPKESPNPTTPRSQGRSRGCARENLPV